MAYEIRIIDDPRAGKNVMASGFETFDAALAHLTAEITKNDATIVFSSVEDGCGDYIIQPKKTLYAFQAAIQPMNS